MECNIGETDKKARIALGIILAAIGLATNTWWVTVLALAPLATVVISFCPVYALIGIDTCGHKKK